MPVRTTIPIGGKAKVTRSEKALDILADGKGMVVAPPSLSDLFEIYGKPKAPSGVQKINEYEEDDGNLIGYATFVAVDPDEQDAVDKWAAQLDEDTPSEIRAKIKRKKKLANLPAHSVKFING